MTVDKMQFIMKHNLEKVKKQYDFIIIDCPPALGMLTVNAMTAANTVIVPIQCEFYALDGLTQLIYTIELIQKSLNPDLTIEGVVFTMYDARTNLSLQVVENVKSYLNQNIYKTIIPKKCTSGRSTQVMDFQSICMTLVLQEQKVTTFWQKKLSKMEVKINVSKKKGLGRGLNTLIPKAPIVDEEDVEQVKKKKFLKSSKTKKKRRNEKGTYFANR